LCPAASLEAMRTVGIGPFGFRAWSTLPVASGRKSACATKTGLEEGGAAVYVDGLAGDGGGLIGAEEQRGAGDFVRSLTAAL
jgi:hypothetical protein